MSDTIVFEPLTVASTSENTTGDGIALLPALQMFGQDAAGNYGFATLPALTVDGHYAEIETPNGGSGAAALPALVAEGAGGTSLYGTSIIDLPALQVFGLEAAGAYGVATLPSIVSSGYDVHVPPTAYIYAFPRPTMSVLASETWAADDWFSVGSSTGQEVTTVLKEFLSLGHAVVPTAHMAATISELLRLTDRQTLVSTGTIDEILALAESVEATPRAIAAIIDALVLGGSATNTLLAMAQVTEVLALREALASVQLGDVTDAAAFAELLDSHLTALEALVAEAVFGAEATGLATVNILLADSVVLDDQVTPQAAFIAALKESLDFSVGFVFDDIPYLAVSLTAASKAATTYTNYPFDSMAGFAGKTYATGDGGLYRLGGTTDAGDPIVWRIRTGLSNLGTNQQKGLDAAYLGYTASGRIHLKCIVVAPDGRKIAHWYELSSPGASSHRPGRIMTGRGLRSVYWGFELTNITEGDVDLDTIELHPVVFEGRLP